MERAKTKAKALDSSFAIPLFAFSIHNLPLRISAPLFLCVHLSLFPPLLPSMSPGLTFHFPFPILPTNYRIHITELPMITPRWVSIYGYVFLVIVVAMLVLVWFRLVPQSMFVPLFLIALVLYMVRITLRLLLERQRRLQEKERAANASATDMEKKPE